MEQFKLKRKENRKEFVKRFKRNISTNVTIEVVFLGILMLLAISLGVIGIIN